MFRRLGQSASDPRAASNDPLLAPILHAGDAQFPQELERLLADHVRPLLGRILGRYGGTGAVTEQDGEDIAATVALRLFEKLQRVRATPDHAVQDFTGYVAKMAYNAINDHLRMRYPERTRLKTRMRYLFTHDPRLELRSSSGGPACALAGWPATDLAGSALVLDAARVTAVMRDRERPAEAAVAVLRAFGKPVLLDALVSFVAELWQITDAPPAPRESETAPVDVADDLETREYLRMLWRELRELRPMQRQALLLNLRDGDTPDVIALLMVTGTASFDELAAAVEMTPAELTAIWNDLPLDDLRIAARLGITRQQVINLRKSARERLARRMGR